MGAGAIVLAGAGVAMVTARYPRRRAGGVTTETRRPGATRAMFVVLLSAAVVAALFDGFVPDSIYQDAPARAHACSG